MSVYDIIKANIDNPEGRVWSLRVAAQPIRGGPLDEYHSFIALVDETDPNNPAILNTLHFLPVNGRGETFTGRRASIADKINIAVTGTGLKGAFRRAANVAGLGEHIFFLKGLTRETRLKLSAIPSTVIVTGPPRQILRAWNDACRAATQLNPQYHLYTSTGLFDNKGNNCRAGAKAALNSAGLPFRPAVEMRTGMRDLSKGLTPPANENARDDLSLLLEYSVLQQKLSRAPKKK